MKKKSEILMRAPHKKSYFISANGYAGFRTHHTAFYDSGQYDRVFVITGGPGTGKSRLMSEVATAVERNGGDVSYIYCSSDPRSLDGIVLEKNGKRAALLDGTAPHIRVTDQPGVIDEWINLSVCWRGESLLSRREEILSLSHEKKNAYARAYRYLGIAGATDAALYSELSPAVLFDKLHQTAERELRPLKPSSAPRESERYLSAFSMRGYLKLDTHRADSRVIAVSDEYGSAHFYLDTLKAILREKRTHDFMSFPSCFDDEKTEAIYLPQNKVMFVEGTEGNSARVINMKRFLDPQKISAARGEIRRLYGLREEMKRVALSAMETAGRYHFELERIYGDAMDFARKEAITSEITARVLSLLDEV